MYIYNKAIPVSDSFESVLIESKHIEVSLQCKNFSLFVESFDDKSSLNLP